MTDIIARCPHCGTDFTPSHLAAEIEWLTTENVDLRRWKALDKPLTAAMAIVVADMQQLRAGNERLRSVLQDMPDIIKDFDGGNPETATGWASEEMLDLWMRVRAALEPKP